MNTRRKRPEVVCLVGSTRFKREYEMMNRALTLEGKIVVTVGVFVHSDGEDLSKTQRAQLGLLHLRKIDMADRVMVINPGDYVGEQTAREIVYARQRDKPVSFMEWHEHKEVSVTFEKGWV